MFENDFYLLELLALKPVYLSLAEKIVMIVQYYKRSCQKKFILLAFIDRRYLHELAESHLNSHNSNTGLKKHVIFETFTCLTGCTSVLSDVFQKIISVY